MKPRSAPSFETRRAGDFEEQLVERARAWIGDWGFEDGERDFGRALLRIAALFSSEVAERLDQAGDKMKRGFLDWLAIGREAARPARLPVVFKMIDTAPAAVLAKAPVQMQVDVDGAPVVLETEQDVNVLPGRLMRVIGVDADQDAFFASPPGFTSLDPREPVPAEWRVRTFAAGNQGKLQVDPELGLVQGMIVSILGKEYEIQKVDKDIVTLDPLLPAAGVAPDTVMRRVDTFAPFESGARNLQEHAIYLGDADLLNVEAAAKIEIVGAQSVRSAATWQYWGKLGEGDEVGWQDLPVAKVQDADGVTLDKPAGAIEPRKVGAIESSRWIRGWMKTVMEKKPGLVVDGLRLRVNCVKGALPCPPPAGALPGAEAQAMANTTPLVLSAPFYPLGREPKQFDAFYLGSAEAFSKKNAKAQVCIEMADATCDAFTVVRKGFYTDRVLAGVGADGALHLFSINPLTGAITPFLKRDPLRPPSPKDGGTKVDGASAVSLNPRCRPVIWYDASKPNHFYVAVAAAGEIWVWHEDTDKTKSGWTLHSRIPDLPGRPALIEDIVALTAAPTAPSAVLSNGRVWTFTGSAWIQPKPTPTSSPLRDYSALVPILEINGDATTSMVAVGALNNRLYRLESDGTEVAVLPAVLVDVGTAVPESAVPVRGMRPATFKSSTGALHIVSVRNSGDALIALKKNGIGVQVFPLVAPARPMGTGIDMAQVGTKLQFSLGLRDGAGGVSVASWIPTFDPADTTVLFDSPIPGASDAGGGTPVTVKSRVVVPGGRGDAFVASFDGTLRREFTKTLIEGAILPLTATPFVAGDFISVVTTPGNARVERTLADAGYILGSEILHALEPAIGNVASEPQLLGYRFASGLTAIVDSPTQITLTVADPAVRVGDLLRIEDTGTSAVGLYRVSAVDNPASPKVITLVLSTAPTPSLVALAAAKYWVPTSSTASIKPVVRFNPWVDGFWDASLLSWARFFFPGTVPPAQRGVAYQSIGNLALVVALQQPWTTPPTSPVKFSSREHSVAGCTSSLIPRPTPRSPGSTGMEKDGGRSRSRTVLSVWRAAVR